MNWWSVGIVMFEKLMGNRRIIDPSKEEDEVLRFSANISSDAKSILQGVSIIFFYLFFIFILTMPKWLLLWDS